MPSVIAVRPPFRKRGQWPLFGMSSTRRGSATGDGGALIGGEATVSFSGVAGQVASDVVIEWDFDNDGNFDESVEDITQYVMSCETFTGRDWPSLLTGVAGPGKFKATLNNNDDRFNFFNESSPLNTDPFTLKTGRKLRVRTSSATSPDPTLYARDSFVRSDSALVADETGHPWIQPTANQFLIRDNNAVAQQEGQVAVMYVDCGQADYYAQVTISSLGTFSNIVGLVYRYASINDYSAIVADLAAGQVSMFDVVAGVQNLATSTNFELYSGLTLGVLVSGATVTGYVEGVSLLSTTALQTSATNVGIYGSWGTGDSAPALSSLSVWSGLTATVEGVLWTGDVSELKATVNPGPVKTVELSGSGWLSKLSTQKVTPATSLAGRSTGLIIGNVLNQSLLADPPGSISQGEITTGVYASDEVSALSAIRDLEETEFGFFHESQEGPLEFDARSARDSKSSLAGFSDATGTQFSYHDISPYSQQQEMFNRVSAGLSPFSEGVEAVLYTDPGPYVLTPGASQQLVASYDGLVAQWTGHTRDVSFVGSTPQVTSLTVKNGTGGTYNVTMPATVNSGDLLIILFVSSGFGVWDGSVPAGWSQLSTTNNYLFKIADGSEDGTNVTLTATSGSTSWASQVFRIAASDWFGVSLNDGVTVGNNSNSYTLTPDAPSVSTPWGAVPTLWINCLVVLVYDAAVSAYPSGYSNGTYTEDTSLVEVAVGSATRTTTSSTEDSGSFTLTASGTPWTSTLTLAIRGLPTTSSISSSSPQGYSPRFTISYDDSIGGNPQPHTNIEVTGIPIIEGNSTLVESNDLVSQSDHNSIRTYVNSANLFATVEDATTYADLVIDKYSSDRPILSMSFYSVKSAAYRLQAIRRRVSDKITLVADHNSGLGVSQDFFIESITHKFSHGTRLWETTWELSPA